MYPHAYRDHWVAQQYLPDMLQGKVFYNPSEQGYEKTVKQEVTLRREAQLEAMVDTGDDEAFGITSQKQRSVKDGIQKQWEKRTSGATGYQLAQIRDHIFDLASMKRDRNGGKVAGRTIFFPVKMTSIKGRIESIVTPLNTAEIMVQTKATMKRKSCGFRNFNSRK